MPSACAVVLHLSASERNRLKTCSSSPSMPHRVVIRATIVRLAAASLPHAVIASRLGLKHDTVRTWRGRFVTSGLDGLTDRPRSGRPPHFTPLQRAEVKAMACHCLTPMGSRCQGGAARSWRSRSSRPGSPRRCRHPRCAGSWRMTRSNRRSTGPGSPSVTPTLPPRPRACWTSTPRPGKANRWAATST
jgi:hypothetical protein